MATFNDYQLLPTLQESLQEQEFTTPTEIQERALPVLLNGESLVGIAETGSGKTLAFTLPILQAIKTIENDTQPVKEGGVPRALVLTPSSDLGEQVSRVFKQFTHTTRLRVRTALGGQSLGVVRKNVANPFEVLVATPGRVEQLLQQNLLSLSDVRLLVLDEADQMLDQGFLPSIMRILKKATFPNRQTALFSATISNPVEALIGDMFVDVQLIQTKGKHQTVDTLTTVNLQVPNGERFPLLTNLLEDEIDGATLLFTNTREQCDTVAELLEENGYESAIYRGDMDKKERRDNLRKLRDGEIAVLICTDLGSRGLDVERVDRVINYHLPREAKNYLHRAGRTARAGREGTVYNFVTKRDENLMKRLGLQD